MKSITEEIQKLISSNRPGVLAIVIGGRGSAPGWSGAKMLVLQGGEIRGTIGGGAFEAQVIKEALKTLDQGLGPRNMSFNLGDLGMSCGGQLDVYLEPIVVQKRVVIYGGGHVAAALVKVLKPLGCFIKVVDEREEWANRTRLADADQIINEPFEKEIAANPPTSSDHVYIITRGHELDQLVLESVITKQPAFLGMIGSRRKVALAKERLKEKGISDELIQTLHSPVGINIGAVTPEEIAISIAAELILQWRKEKSLQREQEL
jgi:xanthine dehydrogenase accessory factor